jgi:chromosome partitioning protein spoOJ
MEITTIKLSQIRPDSLQPRKIFQDAQIDDLAESIKKYGLLQPILVKKQDDRYIIIAGERRYRACKKLGLEYVEVIIKDDENAMLISLIENIQRENLTALEEAVAIQNIKDKYKCTHEELSKLLGKTRVYITNKLRILNADEYTKKLLSDNNITEGHARALLGQRDVKKRQELARKILTKGLSVRQVEKSIRDESEKSSDEDIQKEELYKDLIDMLEEKLCTKISINSIDSENGSIVIDFYSKEQLEDITDMIIGEI